MRAALLFLLASCSAPDRWETRLGTGGDMESPDGGDWERSEWLEVGVSGPLWKPKEPRTPRMTQEPIQPQSAPTAQPIESGGIPWAELALLLGGAGAMKGTDYGVKRYRARKQAE